MGEATETSWQPSCSRQERVRLERWQRKQQVFVMAFWHENWTLAMTYLAHVFFLMLEKLEMRKVIVYA